MTQSRGLPTTANQIEMAQQIIGFFFPLFSNRFPAKEAEKAHIIYTKKKTAEISFSRFQMTAQNNEKELYMEKWKSQCHFLIN